MTKITSQANICDNSNNNKLTKLKRLIGYTLCVLSFACWFLIPALPFLGLSAVQIGSATAGLLILAEVLFWLSVILLGKEFLAKCKAIFKKFSNKFLQRKSKDEDESEIF